MSGLNTKSAFATPSPFLPSLMRCHIPYAKFGQGNPLIGACSPRRRTRCRNVTVTMSYRPPGLLRDAVREKEEQIAQMVEVLEDRPDHPLNLRLAFFSQKPSFRFSRALRRSDGALAILPVLKRVERAADNTLRAVAPLENIGEDARYLSSIGADALMMCTDAPRTAFDMQDFARATRGVRVSNVDPGIPCARHDLIVHPVQIAEACEAGAAAVVIVAAAALADLVELMNSATSMGIEVVVECHTELERDYAIENGATILYLTNHDRAADRIVPGTAEKLAEEIPNWVLTIGGGGIEVATQCWSLLDAGFNAVALGKSLLQSPRMQGFMDEIRSQKSFAPDPFAGRFSTPFEEGTI